MPYAVVDTMYRMGRVRCLVVCDRETRNLIISERIGNWAGNGKSMGGIELELDASPLDVVNDLAKYGWKVVSMQREDDMGEDRKGKKKITFTRTTWTLHNEHCTCAVHREL